MVKARASTCKVMTAPGPKSTVMKKLPSGTNATHRECKKASHFSGNSPTAAPGTANLVPSMPIFRATAKTPMGDMAYSLLAVESSSGAIDDPACIACAAKE